MRDPHVERLVYKITSADDVSYSNPPPLRFTHGIGEFEARDGELVVHLTNHFPDKDAARAVVDPILRAWEIEHDLEFHVGTIRFEYQRADVIDRDPPPPGTPQNIVMLTGVASMAIVGTVSTLRHTRTTYPQPSGSFLATPDLQSVYARWLGFHGGREPLQGMAYFVLTVIEAAAGGRKDASTVFNVDKKILDKVGELTSIRGDASTARKMPRAGSKPLTPAETAWLEAAMKRLIKRLGEQASGAPLNKVMISALPSLV
jgi:hypothetical protein